MTSVPITLVIVTGASRGYGREVCVTFAKSLRLIQHQFTTQKFSNMFVLSYLRSAAHFILVGRDTTGLDVTRSLILNERVSLDAETFVHLEVVDLSDPTALPATAENIFQLSRAQYSKIIFIDNAGMLVHMKECCVPYLNDF